MFTGGLQRVARLTVDEYENQRKKNEERQAIRDQKKVCFPSYKLIHRYFRESLQSLLRFYASALDVGNIRIQLQQTSEKVHKYSSFLLHIFFMVFQIDDDLALEKEKMYLALPEDVQKLPADLYRDPNASLTPGWDEDDEDALIPTDEELLAKRTKEILQNVRIPFIH